jgi:hypothetical protein
LQLALFLDKFEIQKIKTMTILKTLSITLLLAGSMVSSAALTVNPSVESVFNTDYPAKTIVIKNMAAEDINKYFSTGTIFNFEVYKVGSKADIDGLIALFQKDGAVESLNMGTTTADFQAFTLVLKSAKDKQWFINAFKKAGLNTIKVNRNAVVEVEKL